MEVKKEVGKQVSSNTSSLDPSNKLSFRSLGPAFITAALVLGPGSLTVSTNIGALYGYDLIWLLALTTLCMMVFTSMSARIGMSTGDSLLSVVRKKSVVLTILLGIGSFLVTTSFQAGNAIGTGVAIGTLTNTSFMIWTVLFTLFAISLLYFKNYYKILEKFVLAMVFVMLFSFGLTLILVRPDILGLFTGFIPSIPSGSMALTIALVATTLSMVGALYQSYFVQQKGWSNKDVAKGSKETYLGIFMLGLISALLMISAANVLLPQGLTVGNVVDLAGVLEPLYGSAATFIFMIGLWGAAITSLTANATIGGALLADALGLGKDLSKKGPRICIMLVMVFGAAVALIFGSAPLQLIVFAQGVTILVAPLIGVVLLWLANKHDLVGDNKNKLWHNIVGVIGLILVCVMAVNNFINIFL